MYLFGKCFNINSVIFYSFVFVLIIITFILALPLLHLTFISSAKMILSGANIIVQSWYLLMLLSFHKDIGSCKNPNYFCVRIFTLRSQKNVVLIDQRLWTKLKNDSVLTDYIHNFVEFLRYICVLGQYNKSYVIISLQLFFFFRHMF